jgi:hypothetical protein
MVLAVTLTNLRQIRHTFRRTGTTWKLVKREERPEIRI